MARASPVLPAIGGGRTRVQPIRVEDVVRTLASLLERPGTAGATFALVGAETFTFREVLERMLFVRGLRSPDPAAAVPAGDWSGRGFGAAAEPIADTEDVRLLRTDKIAGGLPTPALLGIDPRSLQDGLSVSLRARY